MIYLILTSLKINKHMILIMLALQDNNNFHNKAYKLIKMPLLNKIRIINRINISNTSNSSSSNSNISSSSKLIKAIIINKLVKIT